MARSTQIILAIILLLLVAVAGWLYSRIEWQERNIDLGYSKAAKQNHYLALQQFLAKQNITATVKQGLAGIDKVSGYGTVILSQAYGSLDKQRAERLLKWVEAGGHLIMEAHNPFIHNLSDKKDVIFSQFNVTVIEDEAVDEDLEERLQSLTARLDQSTEKPRKNCRGYSLLGEIKIKGRSKPLTIDFSNDQRLSAPLDDAYGWVATESTDNFVRMVQFQHGDGLISFMGSLKLWRNPYISCEDNAFLLTQLIDPKGNLTLFKNQDSDSLFAKLWQWAPYFILGCILWLVAWLWNKGVRFGPIKHYQPYEIRQIIEHIEAASRLCWQQQQIEEQVDNLRKTILFQLAEKHPGFKQLSQSEQIKRIAKDSHLAYALIEHSLFSPVTRKEVEFTQLLKGLQQIRNGL
ncbi:DUF4350 domain-containing protein [Endozoicomonas sp. SM1973]|uniref:DUF4350 domain-containing protein n=1 Tax=Spartinivicinus marinus TaxID=2994442 RepID=A0A853I7J8_9GAMM|nr:DUF4350 domain-containing protein [Spartinivicinus marinus]MCX4028880.1 DUF4350 domain-containing protein [Spartinivicinus marinus]NYZ65537.1 DUF4350 domain-containing protein [Spartinivicinus marinus]